MNFKESLLAYLTGEKFSSGLDINLDKQISQFQTSDEYLVEYVKNKNIIHVGFVDHLPLIETKILEDRWLHKKLDESAQYCLGIDINEEGVEYVKNNLGYKDVMTLNVIMDKVPEKIYTKKWDYIILADVIEHINNPIEFLQELNRKYKKYSKKVIITTPNAFRYNNFINNFKFREKINTDHRYWFTPYTLAKIASEADYKVLNFELVEHGSYPKRNLFKKYLFNKFPLFRDTLVMELLLND